MRTVRTIQPAPGKTVQEKYCRACGHRAVAVAQIVGRITDYGTGTTALARRLAEEALQE